MRILITGASGFVGRHLVKHLAESGDEVIPTSLKDSGVRLDVEDRASIEKAVEETSPEAVVHLAALASVPESWKDPSATYRTNVIGTSNLLDVLKDVPSTKVLLVGSAQQYAPSPVPLRESSSVVASSPYALSKIAQEQMGMMVKERFGLQVISTRAFNHTGPGQGPHYSVGAFCRQIVEIEKGRSDGVIKVGYLGAHRDFLDVRDVVRAYRLLLDRGVPGEIYNVASGKAVEIRTILQTLLRLAAVDARVEEDRDPRPGDPPLLVGDPSKLVAAVGWAPAISLEESLQDTLEWYRKEETVS